MERVLFSTGTAGSWLRVALRPCEEGASTGLFNPLKLKFTTAAKRSTAAPVLCPVISQFVSLFFLFGPVRLPCSVCFLSSGFCRKS